MDDDDAIDPVPLLFLISETAVDPEARPVLDAGS